MNPRCSAPGLQMALLDEIREGRELSSDLALHLDECTACQIAVERLRRMAEVWTGQEVDENRIALAAAQFYARKEGGRRTPGWFDVVPFAAAGCAAGCLVLLAMGTIGASRQSQVAKEARPHTASPTYALAAPNRAAPSDVARVAPTFAVGVEGAKRVRAQAHIETARGVAPLVNGLRLELQRGESAKVALSDGHASTVEGPCLVEFWLTPTEVGGWRIVREESPSKDERPTTSDESPPRAESVARDENIAPRDVPVESPTLSAADTPAIPTRPNPSAATNGTLPTVGPSATSMPAEAASTNLGAPSNKKSGPTREGNAAAALSETVDSNAQGATGPSVNLGAVRAWSRAAAALREDDFEGADHAFDELSHATDPATRDAARLARAQLWMSRGRERAVRPVLEQLAQTGATPLVRRRASELLYQDVR